MAERTGQRSSVLTICLVCSRLPPDCKRLKSSWLLRQLLKQKVFCLYFTFRFICHFVFPFQLLCERTKEARFVLSSQIASLLADVQSSYDTQMVNQLGAFLN